MFNRTVGLYRPLGRGTGNNLLVVMNGIGRNMRNWHVCVFLYVEYLTLVEVYTSSMLLLTGAYVLLTIHEAALLVRMYNVHYVALDGDGGDDDGDHSSPQVRCNVNAEDIVQLQGLARKGKRRREESP